MTQNLAPENPFTFTSNDELRILYTAIRDARQEGLRPKLLDPYIGKVQKALSISFGEAWSCTEKYFLEEVCYRFFEAQR